MSDAHIEIPAILVQGATLACPHCKILGLDNFIYVEDIENYRKLIKLKDGRLMIESHYEVADDGDNPRLECMNCHKYCALPEDLDYDFE